MGQAIQESGGYGLSDLAVNAHNLYGIKGDEYYQGSVGYAKFVDWDASVAFQAIQLSVPRYGKFKPLIQAGKFKEYGDAIQKAGYCALAKPGQKTYGTMIAEIARTYNLDWIDPVVVLDEAETWAVDNGIVNNPADFKSNPTVDLRRVCWLLYKARGKA